MGKVLVTGVSGFLGAHIVEYLLLKGFDVTGIIRKQSNLWRCRSFEKNIGWIYSDEIDSLDFKENRFEYIVHCAWIGVQSDERNDWVRQSENIFFLTKLLSFAEKAGVNKFITLGSQAEYGYFDGKVSEDHSLNPVCAYGSIKCASAIILKTFCEQKNITWLNLRLFPLFGEMEGDDWLIPSIIKSIYNSSEMNLTKGEQLYSYLYVKDFSKLIYAILIKSIKSGNYNVSSNNPIEIRCLVQKIRDSIKKDFKLNFGNLDYRPNQSMHIEGNIEKLGNEIGEFFFSDFEESLNATIKFYTDKFNK